MSSEDGKTLVIRQVKSAIGQPAKVRRTIRALGIKRHQGTVEHEDDPAIRGMIDRVRHLVTIEER